MERVSWIENGSKFKRVEGNIKNIETLGRGVYNVHFDRNEGWFLTKASEEFVFNYKIYDMENEFINHVITAYNGTNGNIGILLNGIKGTGKTVTAKIIANRLNLPIIIVKSMGDDNTPLMEYLSSFNFDCVLFFDEFEKNFSKKDCSILQIMDGVYSFTNRKVFLLTTNDTTVNDNLISRPSRIRYIKNFGNISESVVREYLADNLLDKSYIEDVVSFVDTLTISTIDILKTIVEDVNVFGYEKFEENCGIFNVNKAKYNLRVRFYQSEDPGYTLGMFKRDVKTINTTTKPSKYSMSEREYELAMKKYNAMMPKISLSNQTFESKRPFSSLKPGMKFGYWPEYNEKIIHIDYENGIIETAYFYGSGQRKVFYFIENKDEAPSLYKPQTYAYSFHEDFDNTDQECGDEQFDAVEQPCLEEECIKSDCDCEDTEAQDIDILPRLKSWDS